MPTQERVFWTWAPCCHTQVFSPHSHVTPHDSLQYVRESIVDTAYILDCMEKGAPIIQADFPLSLCVYFIWRAKGERLASNLLESESLAHEVEDTWLVGNKGIWSLHNP